MPNYISQQEQALEDLAEGSGPEVARNVAQKTIEKMNFNKYVNDTNQKAKPGESTGKFAKRINKQRRAMKALYDYDDERQSINNVAGM